MYKTYVKRILDLGIATILFLLLSPVFLLIFCYLSVTTEDSAIFTQWRPGKNGKLFRIMKFRTMTNTRDQNDELLDDAHRITPAGAFLRKCSLDEIPQLINVIKGDMSLVGPRPLLPEYLPLYSAFQNRRHEVRPGITGWAQVNGRNAIDWDSRLDLDVWYVDNLSFLLDIRIILLTILRVFNPKDVSSPNHVTMEKFTGSKT